MSIMDEDLAAGLISIVVYQQSVKYKSTTIKTSWPACTVTTSNETWIGAYPNSLTILGNSAVQLKGRRSGYFHLNAETHMSHLDLKK